MKYGAIDFETAYFGPGNACSLGMIMSNGQEVVDEWYHLIRPKSLKFDWRCVRVNQIHARDVAEEDPFPAFWDEISSYLKGNIIFAHNARMDMGVLSSTLQIYHLQPVPFLYGDTVALSRVLWKDLPNHKLNTVAEALGFDFHHHQALDDARACEFIVRKALEETGASSVEDMMKETGCALTPFHFFPLRKKKSVRPKRKPVSSVIVSNKE